MAPDFGSSRYSPRVSDPTGARRAQFLGSADWVPRRTGGKAGESAERGGFGRIENLDAVAERKNPHRYAGFVPCRADAAGRSPDSFGQRCEAGTDAGIKTPQAAESRIVVAGF